MQYRNIVSSVVTFAALATPLAAQQTTPAPATAPAAAAQAPARDKVAGIVAVVGDSIITTAFMADAYSRRIAELQQNKLPIPMNEADARSLQDTLLNQHIADLVILQAIARDTTYKVNEETLQSAVEAEFSKVQADAGGPVAFATRLRENGLTAQSYRTLIGNRMRTTELYRQFKDRMSQLRPPPKASQKEIEAFFPEWQAARGPRPAMVSFQQVVVRVQPSDSALSRAKAKADSLYQIILKDREKFDELARRHSEDAGTKEKGGEFGWFVEDEVAKEFGRAAFAAPVGALIPPVRTQFGYHIIEVERHRGNQVQARHILISAAITPDDIARTQARADSAAAKLRAGTDIQDVIKQFGDAQEDVNVNDVDPVAVRENFGIDLTAASKGDIVGPASSAPGPGQLFTIARVTETSAAGNWSLNDPGVRDAIRTHLESQKLLDEVVAELKRDTYIQIRAR